MMAPRISLEETESGLYLKLKGVRLSAHQYPEYDTKEMIREYARSVLETNIRLASNGDSIYIVSGEGADWLYRYVKPVLRAKIVEEGCNVRVAFGPLASQGEEEGQLNALLELANELSHERDVKGSMTCFIPSLRERLHYHAVGKKLARGDFYHVVNEPHTSRRWWEVRPEGDPTKEEAIDALLEDFELSVKTWWTQYDPADSSTMPPLCPSKVMDVIASKLEERSFVYDNVSIEGFQQILAAGAAEMEKCLPPSHVANAALCH